LTDDIENDLSPPTCPEPECQSPMVLRTARRGRNAGGEFWGCSQYPKCRGTRSVETPLGVPGSSDEADPTLQASGETKRLPVVWTDHVGRSDWISEYTSIGAFPGFAREFLGTSDEVLIQCMCQCQILSSRSRQRDASDDARALGALLAKLLQRGRTPLPTLGVERNALESNSLGDWLVELPASDPEIGIELSRGFDGRLTRDAALQALSERKPFKLDKEFSLDRRTDVSLFDSEIEERFFCEWIPSALGPNSAHWFVPQASLDRLLESHGIFEAGARRVDFLFA
jgi:ssDNA-binding Zn-finger/Zn-ribbon topoisomerase 1